MHNVITMRTSVVKIGNSKGIRIPKAILTECQIEEEVDLILENDRIIIVPFKKNPRSGWEEKFMEMSQFKEDELIISDSLDLDYKDWEW